MYFKWLYMFDISRSSGLEDIVAFLYLKVFDSFSLFHKATVTMIEKPKI